MSTRAAARRQATVCVSITTLDSALARRLEPRATAPVRRLDTCGGMACIMSVLGIRQ